MYHHNRNRYFDSQKLVVIVLKTCYKKQKPKITHCRSYKNFENDNFRKDLTKILLKFGITNDLLSKFNNTVLSVLDKHAQYVQRIATL